MPETSTHQLSAEWHGELSDATVRIKGDIECESTQVHCDSKLVSFWCCDIEQGECNPFLFHPELCKDGELWVEVSSADKLSTRAVIVAQLHLGSMDTIVVRNQSNPLRLNIFNREE